MTSNDPRRDLAPRNHHDPEKTGDRQIGPIRDPLSLITNTIGDDPSIDELLAFRDAIPDLKAAAREARRCADEADRMGFPKGDAETAAVALQVVGLACAGLVAIWPSDTLAEAEAKLALKQNGGPYGADTAYDTASMLEASTAVRIRLKRAAFDVGELMLPPGPALPAGSDRGLLAWPLTRFDLVDHIPRRGGEVTLSSHDIARWSAFLINAPELAPLVERAATLFATADRLCQLAHHEPADTRPLLRAAEAARIVAYLLAAEVAVWPAERGSANAAAKKSLVGLIDQRASRNDPSHQQAAIRHLFSEAIWPAKRWCYGCMALIEPDWTPIV